MNDSKRIPVAVVGVGRMGQHHARVYHELPSVQLLTVVDADAQRRDALADKFGCDALASVDELLEKYPHVQAASVAVPTVHHEAVAGQLMAHGVACLVEKPLAQSADVAHRMVESAKKFNVLLQVGHTERFNPAVRAIASWNFIPRFIECDRVSPMTFRSVDVGVVFDMMIHDLDIVLKLARGKVKDVAACGVNILGTHEDIADARIVFDDGCVAKLTASRLAMKTERKLRVFSESGYVSLDYASKSGTAIRRTGNIEQLLEIRNQLADGADLSALRYTDLVAMEELTINDEEPLRAELTNFIEAVKGDQKPEVDAEAGLAAVNLAEAVVTAIRNHEWKGLDLKKLI
ncbi:MAG: Gfo/Idh/MocA family oxidoreductase [Phycisphaeraceae bacterium]